MKREKRKKFGESEEDGRRKLKKAIETGHP